MNKPRGQRRAGERPPGAASRLTATSGGAAAHPIMDVEPFNARHLEEAREQWALANWKGITDLRSPSIAAHPDRGPLAIVNAAALLQMGDRAGAREHAWQAAEWACGRHFMAKVLLASARHALGRASAAAGRTEQAAQHFQQSLFDPRMLSEARRLAQARLDEVSAELAVRREAAARNRKVGIEPEDKSATTRIAELVARCLAAPDLHEAVDGVLERLLATPDERVRLLMQLAEHFRARGDRLIGVHYLSTARELAAGAGKALRHELAKRLVAAGQQALAMDLLFDDTLADAQEGLVSGDFVQSIRKAYQTVRDSEQASREHGHELLLAHLKLQLPRLRSQAGNRPMSMVEIGTTRESVPGQGSTRRLGEFCKEHGIEFVTVDMDPHNSRVAQKMFDGLAMGFEAVTMKGEDYLRQRKEPLDFVFLDAYDFDHGQHSELRQSRYLKFLGSRIDEQACHQMHLDCAQSVLRLLSPVGVVCIDDTWLENGAWTAKGTLAMPYLLQNGFELIDARNRAALLKRAAAAGA